ncbi:LysR family transcriptional regulator [Phreatobacter aquaticus]|uniref:LysR family transcriptional regulator n=1 Tax=Phreatobacter aquaticus TaxID=2570229 RepID=A0A4D7QFR3_9HYPH|nr:LysR family transcriptional regulator [Phreatobacter aquaticus]QCK84493.1 LysR family transcriptional regulator [Phreatobacter aquaticus]
MNFIHAKQKAAIDVERLGLITSFVAVAEHLSFVEAANALGQTPSTISRKVTRLEDSLGTRLLERTTRRVAMTEAGRLYYDQCVTVLGGLAQAEALVESLSTEPRGLLRISIPVAFGRLHLSSAILDFMEQYPDVRVEANYSDRFVNLIEEAYDLVVRIGHLPDSNLIVRKIAANKRWVVASPGYLARCGTPLVPADLATHSCMSFTHYSAGGNVWRFQRGDDVEVVKVSGDFRSDNSEAVLEATRRGAGISVIAAYLCHDSIRRGELIPLLTDWSSIPEAGIYVAFTHAKHISPKVRCFIDMLSQRFRSPPWILD